MSFVVNFLTSPKTANFVQNSACQVLSEGSLKAAGRPVFTLMDDTATKEERQYSATKEFLYQSLSMASYFGLIFPVKNNTHKLLGKFPQLTKYNSENKANLASKEQIDSVLKAKNNDEFKTALSKITDKEFLKKVNGAQELMSILASGVILAIVAPQIVNKIIHPILNLVTQKTNEKDKNSKLDKNV